LTTDTSITPTIKSPINACRRIFAVLYSFDIHSGRSLSVEVASISSLDLAINNHILNLRGLKRILDENIHRCLHLPLYEISVRKMVYNQITWSWEMKNIELVQHAGVAALVSFMNLLNLFSNWRENHFIWCKKSKKPSWDKKIKIMISRMCKTSNKTSKNNCIVRKDWINSTYYHAMYEFHYENTFYIFSLCAFRLSILWLYMFFLV